MGAKSSKIDKKSTKKFAQKLFEIYDLDKDGAISKAEMRQILEVLMQINGAKTLGKGLLYLWKYFHGLSINTLLTVVTPNKTIIAKFDQESDEE